jgi:hypothetical protein
MQEKNLIRPPFSSGVSNGASQGLIFFEISNN